jgi:hypothetical protein
MGRGGDGDGKGGGFNFYTTSQRFSVDQYLVAKHTWLKADCKTSHMSCLPHHRKLYGCTCKGNHSMTKFKEQLGHKLSLYRVLLYIWTRTHEIAHEILYVACIHLSY